MSKPREKMSVAMRAKQFMPFSALKGFEEAIAAMEKENEERTALSEEMEERLNDSLSKIERGNSVTVTYYSDGEYMMKSGMLTEFDAVLKNLRIDDGEYISFTDILDIENEEEQNGNCN